MSLLDNYDLHPGAHMEDYFNALKMYQEKYPFINDFVRQHAMGNSPIPLVKLGRFIDKNKMEGLADVVKNNPNSLFGEGHTPQFQSVIRNYEHDRMMQSGQKNLNDLEEARERVKQLENQINTGKISEEKEKQSKLSPLIARLNNAIEIGANGEIINHLTKAIDEVRNGTIPETQESAQESTEIPTVSTTKEEAQPDNTINTLLSSVKQWTTPPTKLEMEEKYRDYIRKLTEEKNISERKAAHSKAKAEKQTAKENREAENTARRGAGQPELPTVEEGEPGQEEINPGDIHGSDTWQGTPQWYATAIQQLTKRAMKESKTPYIPYSGERTAEPSIAQKIAKKRAYEAIENPDFADLFQGAKENLGRLSKQKSVDEISQYMNPYEGHVLNNLEARMNKNFKENILPQIDTQFISRGAYRSTNRQAMRERAAQEMQEAYGREAGQLMHQGYQGAQAAAAQDLERQQVASREMEDLKSKEQESTLRNIDLIDEIGTREQQLEQAKKNTEYEDFIKQRNYFPEQTGRLSELIRGLPVNYQTSTTNPYQPQASPYTQMAGGLQSMYALHQQGQDRKSHKKGGRVKLAGGGTPTPMPVANQDNDYQNRLKMALQQVQGSGSNPMWGMLANMGANVAANSSEPNAMRAIVQSMPAGVEGYHTAAAQNSNREQQALNLTKMIEDSKRYEEDRQYTRQLNKEKMDLEKAIHFAKMNEPAKTNESLQFSPSGEGYIVGKQNGSIANIKPFTGMGGAANPKVMAEVEKEELKDIYERGREASARLPMSKRLVDLSSETGGQEIFGEQLPSSVANIFSPENRAEREEFDALSKQLVRKNIKGLGSMSQSEINFWNKASPNLSQSEEGKKILATANYAIDLNEVRRKKFISKALNSGIPLQQSEEIWNDFEDKYPVLGENLIVNKDNLELDPFTILTQESSQQQQPTRAPQAVKTESQITPSEAMIELKKRGYQVGNERKAHKKGGHSIPIVLSRKESLKEAMRHNV